MNLKSVESDTLLHAELELLSDYLPDNIRFTSYII